MFLLSNINKLLFLRWVCVPDSELWMATDTWAFCVWQNAAWICTKFHWENINFRPILISFLKWNFKSHVYTQIWIARSFWQEAIRSNSSLFYQTCGRAGGRIMQNLKWTIVYVYITACVQFMSFQHNNTAGLWGVGGKLKKTPLCFLCHKSTRPVCDKPW